MGSSFRLPIWENTDFEEVVLWAGRNGYQTVCADTGSESELPQINWLLKTLVVFGSEAHGLSAKQRSFVDSGFHIRINPLVESLNLATAASITLYQANQSRSSG
jgi:TrmH family RNA methyltransferase